MHQKTVELRRELSNAERNLQAASSSSASTRFREQNLEKELELTKKNNEWFETELKAKSAEYLKFRREKSARLSELQRENEEASATVESLRRNENTLKARVDEMEHQYEESLNNIQRLKEEAIQASESFRIELDSTNRLAQLQGASAETAKQRVQECQVALERTKDNAAEEISRIRVEVDTEHSDKEAAERRVAELELAINQLETEGRAGSTSPGHGLNTAGPSTPLRSGSPVGTFSPRVSRVKGGLTLTQMYTEYDKMRSSLTAEQKANRELKETLDDMVQDLESSKPEIDELRADQARLETAVVEMSEILETSGKERDEATREARKWQGEIEGMAHEGNVLRQQLRDLSSQVRVLVLEVALHSEGEHNYDRQELEKIAINEIDESSADLSATARFISHNLTTFKDLRELQEQNVTLRRMLRELGEKMEGAEAREKESVRLQEQEELKELRIRVQTYRDEIANLIAQTNSYVKERDTFRSMIMRRRQAADGGEISGFSQSLPLGAVPPTGSDVQAAKDEPDYGELLRKLQVHFDSFRNETATDHTTLKQQVNDLARRNSELLSEVSRSSSQLAAASKRSELLQDNFNMLKSENTELQKRYSSIMENANRQDVKTQQAAEDLVEAKGLIDSLQRESANLKAEKDLWKSIEERLIEDNELVRNERSRLDSLNASLQSILNEREHTDSESRRRLQSAVETLESELQSTKRHLNGQVEEAKSAALRREYEHEQSQKRIDDLVASLGAVREELVAAKTSRDHLQSRVDEISVELRSAEERVQVVQSKPTTVQPAVTDEAQQQAPNETTDAGGLTHEQELSMQVSELKRDLQLAKSELEHSKEQVEDYKAISQSTEERLQSISETQEQYREDTEKVVEEKDKKIESLEKRVEEISAELSASNGELAKLRDEQAEEARASDEEKAYYKEEAERLRFLNEHLSQAARSYQDNLSAEAQIAQQAQQNYENELVKHAEAAKVVQTIREEANRLKIEGLEYKSRADTLKWDLSQKEGSWAELRVRYESEISELHKRREEVLHQNSLLHDQLENITKQITSLQRDRASNFPQETETADEGDTAPNLESLQEVIRYLRREKEIVDVQYHLSTQEGKRLRQRLEYTQTQLDETNLKLEQERRAATDSERSALNHNKLMETLNELNLFRESSVTLRTQLKNAERELAEKSARVGELTKKMIPFEARVRELQSVVETRDGEMKLLQEDRDRWQQRTQNILQKYDRVDPIEMESLKEKLASLEKERDEAVSARDTLQAQAAAFPEQLKHAEDRVTDLRTKLTDQFKARSKDLTGRINAKQMELNTVVQEKDVIQEELKVTKEELDGYKARGGTEKEGVPTVSQGGPETDSSQAPSTASGAQPTGQGVAEKISALEEKIQRLEAALAEKDAALNAKDAELADKVARLSANKPETIQQDNTENPTPATPGTPGTVTSGPPATPSKEGRLPELTEEQAKELVAKNVTIQSIVRNNIRTFIAREKERQGGQAQGQEAGGASANQEIFGALEKKFSDERESLKKSHQDDTETRVKSAVELADKKSVARISMLETRGRAFQAKIEVVQKAATETPQKPVVEVWEIARVARPVNPVAPVRKPSQQTASPSVATSQQPTPPPFRAFPPRTPVPPTPQNEQAGARPVPSPVPQGAQTQGPQTPTVQSAPQPIQQPHVQAPQPSQQPGPPQTIQQPQTTQQPQAHQQPQVHQQPQTHQQPRPLQSQPQPQPQPQSQPQSQPQLRPQPQGQHPQVPQQQNAPQQPPSQENGPVHNGPQSQSSGPPGVLRALQSGLPVARGGRGGFIRGRGTTTRGQRGGFNVQARQFIPQGNKRPREDGQDGGGGGGGDTGKRIRGGANTRGGGS